MQKVEILCRKANIHARECTHAREHARERACTRSCVARVQVQPRARAHGRRRTQKCTRTRARARDIGREEAVHCAISQLHACNLAASRMQPRSLTHAIYAISQHYACNLAALRMRWNASRHIHFPTGEGQRGASTSSRAMRTKAHRTAYWCASHPSLS
eukprot:511822-Pleurochrysis_carterae.AAC.4